MPVPALLKCWGLSLGRLFDEQDLACYILFAEKSTGGIGFPALRWFISLTPSPVVQIFSKALKRTIIENLAKCQTLRVYGTPFVCRKSDRQKSVFIESAVNIDLKK
ncbi:hypothetical protein TNCV_5058631 [Trichonephila clavipes]|nr:hypothetical protein TNCV_5058631 [Trichonephila clavipes]